MISRFAILQSLRDTRKDSGKYGKDHLSMLKKKPLLIYIFTLSLLAIFSWLWFGQRYWNRGIADLKKQLASETKIDFSTSQIFPTSDVKVYQSHSVVHEIARLGDSYFFATSGGLVEYSTSGEIKRHYTTADGLASSNLTAIENYNGQLFLGSATGELFKVSSDFFTSYKLAKKAQRISNLTVNKGKLLVGASGLGLLEYDGSSFSKVEPLRLSTKSGSGFVTEMVEAKAVEYYGTFTDGLFVRSGGRWLHSTTNDGLPSNRVLGIAVLEDSVYVGTDFGIALLGDIDMAGERIAAQVVAPLPGLSSLVQFGEQIYACRDSGEVYRVVTDRKNSLFELDLLEQNWSSVTSCRLQVVDNRLFLLNSEGVWILSEEGRRAIFQRFDRGSRKTLSDNMVSSIAIDDQNRIWAGLFTHGIDILSSDGGFIKHLEDEKIREVNLLKWDEVNGKMLAATSAGLFEFDSQFFHSRVSKEQGILSDSISGLTLISGSLFSSYLKGSSGQESERIYALSTGRGLAVGRTNNFRNYTTFNGLPSNSVYATATVGKRLYVGTLGGLAIIEGGRVVRTIKQSNSKLSANWVTALAVQEGLLFIGTYGGGIDLLLPNGEIKSLSSEIGKFEVNLNAILVDGRFVYVGTLDVGLWVFDSKQNKWKNFRSGLPSQNIMSIARSGKHLFLATESGVARLEVKRFEN